MKSSGARSAMFPMDMKCDSPILSLYSTGRTAPPSAPLCVMNATFPLCIFGSKDACRFAGFDIIPAQFGPNILILLFFAVFTSCSSRFLFPVSENPAEITMAVLSFPAASLITFGVYFAGIDIIARSICWGTSFMFL